MTVIKRLRRCGFAKVPRPAMRKPSFYWNICLTGRGRGAEMEAWYRHNAEQGDVMAMCRLASAEENRGNLEQAEQWLRKAVDSGAGDAIDRLERLLRRQERQPEIEIVCRQADAMVGLARLLERAGDMDQAKSWLRRAAESGDTEAVLDLAALLRRHGNDPEIEHWLPWATEIERTHRGFQPCSAGDWVAPIAVITVAIVPFVNALLARAANDTYEKARSLLRRLVDREGRDDQPDLPLAKQLLIVEDPDPRLNLAIHLWADTPDGAIRALKDLDLEKLSAGATGVGKVRIYWNRATQSWQILDDGTRPSRKGRTS